MTPELQTTESRPDGPLKTAKPPGKAGEASLGELFRDLARESSTLIRQEVALAKAEMRENVRALAKDAGKLAIGGALLLVAFLVLNAFLVVLIGDALDNYWLAALALGVVYLLAGGALVMSGKKGLQRDDLKPDQTLQTLREDRSWAEREARQIKTELTS